ncbi:MAG: hypothetical protein SPJ27_01570 [Candidatus Onthovivens sp.]|nr:hypothetical protein [Candidatus Onthovivens sp.]
MDSLDGISITNSTIKLDGISITKSTINFNYNKIKTQLNDVPIEFIITITAQLE